MVQEDREKSTTDVQYGMLQLQRKMRRNRAGVRWYRK